MVLAKVVSKAISISFCLFLIWVMAKFMFWLWPEGKWLHLICLVLLSVDYALIVSGIKPHGFASWFKKEQ